LVDRIWRGLWESVPTGEAKATIRRHVNVTLHVGGERLRVGNDEHVGKIGAKEVTGENPSTYLQRGLGEKSDIF